jgi:hypothetical protein
MSTVSIIQCDNGLKSAAGEYPFFCRSDLLSYLPKRWKVITGKRDKERWEKSRPQ